MTYTNSPLVSYTRLSPHHSGTRTHAIDRITVHHVVGLLSVEALGAEFCGSRDASSNYGIGKDARVGLYVPESCRSHCSSSAANDQRAVTIECADEPIYPYTFSSAVYSKLIELCIDICKRNGKKKLIWIPDKTSALNYAPASDEMLLTVHRWFLNTQCPGQWMMDHMGDLAEKVTKQLGGTNVPTTPVYINTCTVNLPILQKGSRGSYVKTLQKLLIAHEPTFTCGGCGADGDFGNGTLAAVKNFQTFYKLGADGVVGEKTWNKLIGG